VRGSSLCDSIVSGGWFEVWGLMFEVAHRIEDVQPANFASISECSDICTAVGCKLFTVSLDQTSNQQPSSISDESSRETHPSHLMESCLDRR
jgi:hypothetical protein